MSDLASAPGRHRAAHASTSNPESPLQSASGDVFWDAGQITPPTPFSGTESGFSFGSSGEDEERGDGDRRSGPDRRGDLILEHDDEDDQLASDLEDEDEGELSAFIPGNRTSISRHRRNPSSSESLHQSSSSGPLTILWTTLNLANTSISPSILALPYAVSLLRPPLFIVSISIMAFLSAASHVVIVYVARYLGVRRFEDLGRGLGGGRVFREVLRGALVASGMSLFTLYLRMMAQQIVSLVVARWPLAPAAFASARFWSAISGLAIFPLLVPFHLHSGVVKSVSLFAATLPILILIITIATSVYIHGDPTVLPIFPPPNPTDLGVLLGSASSWGGFALLAFSLSSHLSSLPTHSGLIKASQRSFAVAPFLENAATLGVLIPLAIVSYFVLPAAAPPPMIFDAFPQLDRWLIVARLSAYALAGASLPMVFLPTRDAVARGLRVLNVRGGGLEGSGGRRGKEFWGVTVVLWAWGTGMAVLPDAVVARLLLLGISGCLFLGYLFPAILFIVLFHLRRPLSIILSTQTSSSSNPLRPPQTPRTPSQINPFADPMDALLQKKERQLQKRRTGRRLWQDAVVFVGILPMGCVVVAWSLGRTVGFW